MRLTSYYFSGARRSTCIFRSLAELRNDGEKVYASTIDSGLILAIIIGNIGFLKSYVVLRKSLG